MPKKNVAGAASKLFATLADAQARLYQIKNVCEAVALAAYSDGRGEPDHPTWGSMRVASRELQAVIDEMDAIQAEHCEPMAEEAA